MFKTVPCLRYAGIRVSADTKTCPSTVLRTGVYPLYPAPTGGLRLPAGKHTDILTDFQTTVNKKINKKKCFFGPLPLARVTFPTNKYGLALHSDLIIRKIAAAISLLPKFGATGTDG